MASLAAPQEPTAAQPHVIFLNRCVGGLTITKGMQDSSIANVSMILDQNTNFPAYGFGDESWNEVVSLSRELFAPFNVVITDVDPTPMPHDEVVVCGGDWTNLGAAGVAPFTCGQIANPITYVFPDVIGDDRIFIAETIGQEVAHAWGLDHSYKCEDPMTYLFGCGRKSFQDGDFRCGEDSERDCDCGGATQNTYQHILGLFGAGTPDTQVPVASIVYPTDGERFDVGASFDVEIDVTDDVGVAAVRLYADGEMVADDTVGPFEGWPVSNPPEGTQDLYLEAVDLAGNVSMSGVVTIHVGTDGPGGADGAGTGGGDDGGADGDDGEGDDGDGTIPPDSVPPGFGNRDSSTGCGCTTTSPATPPAVLLLLIAGFGLSARRRR